jgi:hypothetical protein
MLAAEAKAATESRTMARVGEDAGATAGGCNKDSVIPKDQLHAPPDRERPARSDS